MFMTFSTVFITNNKWLSVLMALSAYTLLWLYFYWVRT